MTKEKMSNADITRLERMINERRKLRKQKAKQYKTELIADFEKKMNIAYLWNSDEVWAKLRAEAEEMIGPINDAVQQRAANSAYRRNSARRYTCIGHIMAIAQHPKTSRLT